MANVAIATAISASEARNTQSGCPLSDILSATWLPIAVVAPTGVAISSRTLKVVQSAPLLPALQAPRPHLLWEFMPRPCDLWCRCREVTGRAGAPGLGHLF